MKLSLKKAFISAVVVLAGVSLFMPVASSFAVAESVQLENSTTAPTTPSTPSTSSSTTNTSSGSSSSSASANLPEATTARCEAGALGWVMCPVIKLGQDFVGSMEKLIVDKLDTGPIQTTGRYENLHKAWAGFRDLANVFFIGIFIVIIFAQTLSIKMDSYSIKMMMPRLIIAVIAIQFSFFIMQIGVDISNIVGNGIAGIFNDVIKLGPEGGAAVSTTQAFGALTIVGAGGALAAGTAIVTGLAVPALLLLLAAAISLLGVIITVWLRVLVLQFLILLAPLAIVAWVMPNTEKWFTAWRVNVVKLLLMYPIIVFMISAGALATHITAVSAEDGNFAKILAACVPIIIFLMIPTAIKASGSLMNMTGNFVMGRMNGYSKAVRSSKLMTDAKADLKDRAALTITDNDKNLDRLKSPGQKGAAMLRRGAGRAMSGNAMSFGTVGRRNIAKSTEHARHQLEEDWKTLFRENAFENPTLRDIAMDGMDHNKAGKTEKITDRYGKEHKVKYGHHMAEAAISQLVAQSGFVELSDMIDGKKDATGTQREGGLFNHEVQMWRDKETQATMNRAFGPNAGNVLKKITHAVHLQADRAYGAIGAQDFANLGAGSGIVAAREAREWGATNMLNAMINISNSNNLTSTIQNDVAAAMKRELMGAAAAGKFDDIKISTRDHDDMTAAEWLNEYVADSGHVTYLSGDIRRDGINEAIQKEKLDIDPKVEALNARREEFKQNGPQDHH